MRLRRLLSGAWWARLGLGGWPPVASHVACLLVGGALAHAGPATPARPTPLPLDRGLSLALPADERMASPDVLRPGARVLAARRATRGGEACLATTRTLVVAATTPRLVLSAPPRAADALAAAAAEAARRRLLLVPAGVGPRPPACRQAPKVSYGGS